MDIISDFAILATAIAVAYPTVRLWRYVVSRGHDVSPPSHTQQIQALEKSVRTINDSQNVWTRLSQTEVALKSATALAEMLPTDLAVQEQITHLKTVRIALANAALRSKVDQLGKRITTEGKIEDMLKQGKELLRFLEQEKRKQSADIRLIEHYHASMKWYLDRVAQADAVEVRSKDKAAVTQAYEVSLSHLLENELPETVAFFDGAEFKLDRLAHSLGKGERRAVSYSP